MSHRVRTTKRLLFPLLLAASLLLVPFFVWVGCPLLYVLSDDGSAQAEVTNDAFTNDVEGDFSQDDARPATRFRFRKRRLLAHALQVTDRAAEKPQPFRFALVVDVRPVKPKRLVPPPYLRPRVVRLLS